MLNDFEKFIEDTTGQRLPVFGRDLFLNVPADFAPATGIAAPGDYVVGPGDQIKIRAWGNVSVDVQSSVDRNGQIFIPQIGTLLVAGMRLDQLQGFVRASIGKQFKTFDLSVTLGQLRSIQVFVLGEARRPGVYTVSSLSTLVNALFTSGGPSATGTMRDIQLKRGDKVLTHFDVYDLLLQGDKSKDVHLMPGDILFIPVIGPQVALTGQVNKPGIYEVKTSTTVDQVLQFAGGLSTVASRERASLDRIVDQRRVVQDFPLTGAQRLIQVQAGDVLRVFPISAKIEKIVTLRGNVGTPGRYPWHVGMRVSDLIPNRTFLLTRRYYNQQNALSPAPLDRPFSANATQNDGTGGSRVVALSADRAAAVASSAEALASEPHGDLASHETEINWNYAVIERLGEKDLKTELVPFVLGEAVDTPSSTENKELAAGDVVVVYSRSDINLPSELRAGFVRIDGEVNKPGIYQLAANETLRDVLQRAGGIAPHGYLYASQLLRESVRVAEELKLQALIQQESRDVLSPANQSVSTADGRTSTSDIELRRAYIQALGQIHATGRVTLQLSPTAEGSGDVPDFALQDGDHFFIPARPNTVDVLGSVFNQGSLRYTKDGKIGTYLKVAGGHTREGDKEQEFVLRADGTVLSRHASSRFEKLIIYPGDTVVVPARLRPGFNAYQLINFSQVISSFAIAALAIRSLQ